LSCPTRGNKSWVRIRPRFQRHAHRQSSPSGGTASIASAASEKTFARGRTLAINFTSEIAAILTLSPFREGGVQQQQHKAEEDQGPVQEGAVAPSGPSEGRE